VLAYVLAPVAAASAHGLGPFLDTRNFVEVGDAIVDLLDASGVTLAAVTIGSSGAAAAAVAQTASLRPARPRLEPRAQESACPGGGRVRVTAFDADGSEDLSPGDRVASVFEQCAIDGSVIRGRSEFVVRARRLEGKTQATELDFEFADFGTAHLHWSGRAHLRLVTTLPYRGEHYRVSYSDLRVQLGERAMRWDFVLDVLLPPIGGPTVSFDGPVAIDALRLRFHQDEAFAVAERGWPRSGRLTAADERGARLQLEAEGEHYAYRLYGAGTDEGPPEAVSQSRPWDAP
jgi:hypothetical protein